MTWQLSHSFNLDAARPSRVIWFGRALQSWIFYWVHNVLAPHYFPDWQSIVRCGAYDPEADHRLCVSQLKRQP